MTRRADIDSLAALVDALKRKCPYYLDLFTAATNAEFEAAFDGLLGKALMHLETNSKNFETLDENGLSAVLAGAIQVPGLMVTQETNSNGHVDLTITADFCSPARRKLAEAKIWRGPTYHVEGVRQLLTRYTTGRESRGLLISYVRQRNIKTLFSNLRNAMDTERPCEQTSSTTNHDLQWAFVSIHQHSSGEAMEVAHVGCNLFSDTTSESST